MDINGSINVTTNPDECKDVGYEIGAYPKRKTTNFCRRYSQCLWWHKNKCVEQLTSSTSIKTKYFVANVNGSALQD